MAGKRPVFSRRGHRAVEAAVRRAEERTGLQFCVYLGPASRDTRAHAEDLFTRAGLHERPAVLIHVAPEQRSVEVVTAPDARARISDEHAQAAVTTMTAHFARGDLAEGIVAGVDELADRAGGGRQRSGGTNLPDVVDEA